MPSLAISPAVLTWTAQDASFRPERITVGAASLAWTAQDVAFSAGGTGLSVTTPVLDRLTDYDRPQGFEQREWRRQVIVWQRAMEKIEEAFEALSQQVSDNTTLLNQIQEAMNLAQAANDNAVEVADRTSLTDSYISPVSVLTASSDGIVLIAAHERIYGNGSRVSVNSGSVSGFASGDYVSVYYKDAGREGGAVTYHGTTSAVAQKDTTHVVGQVTIPEAGAGTTTGSSPSAPGYTPPGTGTDGPSDYIEP